MKPEKTKKKLLTLEDELRGRIYDIGFNLGTMPSVRRSDTQASSNKPLVVKLMPQNAEQNIYSKQATVFKYQRKNVSEKQIKYEKNSNRESLPNIPENQDDVYQNRNVSKDKNQRYIEDNDQMGKSNKRFNTVDKYNPLSTKNNIIGVSDDQFTYKTKEDDIKNSNKFGSTQNEFKMADQQKQSFSQYQQIGNFSLRTNQNLRKMQNATNTGFMEHEMHRTKYIVDKVSGKFDIDGRYNNQDEYNQFKPQEIHKQIDQRKRALTDVDHYIELCKQNITNVDNFVYLARYNSDDPYDLKIVEYGKIKNDNLKEYYTLSKKGFCQFLSTKPTSFMSMEQWIKERDNYDEIKRLTFFTKFRKWKTLKMWRTNVTRHKTSICKKILEEKLFLLHPFLGKTLLTQRLYTCDMQQLRFVDMQLSKISDLPTLENFKEQQDVKRKIVSQRITDYSRKSRENIRQGILSCLETLKKSNHKSQENDLKKEGQNVFKLKQSAYENLGFPDNMTYEQRSELRQECSRFLRFSYLIDFIGLESLITIYKQSVQELITELYDLAQYTEPIIFKERNQRPLGIKQKEPMFYLQVDYDFEQIDPQNYQIEVLPEFVPPPIGKMTYQDFNILYHVRLIQLDENQDEDEEPKDIVDENATYQRIVIPNLYQLWLKLKPNQEVFFNDLLSIVSDGLTCLQTFERWSRHDEMTPYVSVLEEWDDLVGDDWEQPMSNFLNPQDWLDQQSLDLYSKQLKQMINLAFESTQNYLKDFNQYLMIYWENSQIQIDTFLNDNLSQPVESFQQSLALLQYQSDFLDQNIPCQADIGLLRIDNYNLKQQLVPNPIKIINELKKVLPALLRKKTLDLKEWFNKQTAALKSNNTSIDEFVRQQNSLKYAEKNYQKVKDKISIIQAQYISLKGNKFDIKKEDDQLFLDVVQNSNALQIMMQNVTETSEKSLEGISNKITKQLIPALNKSVFELDTQLQDSKFLTLEILIKQAINELLKIDEQVVTLEENSKKYNFYQQTLNIDVTRFDDLFNLRNDLNMKKSIWISIDEWEALILQWIDTPFAQIDAESIKIKCDYYTKIINKCIKFMPPNPVLDKLKELVFEFKDTIPVVTALRNSALTDIHWLQIKQDVIGYDFNIYDPQFTLQSLIDLDAQQHQQKIQEISNQATQESILEQMFYQIEKNWKKLEFTCQPYKQELANMKDVYVISEVDDLLAKLDENLANLNNILGSRYLKNARARVSKLQEEILFAQDCIDNWLCCQKDWTYLENIFNNGEIKKTLAHESGLFDKFDNYFKNTMRKTNQKKQIHQIIPSIVSDQFKKHKETLNQIQKALDQYLESKRSAFPRFYFLSNDELLEILAKANDIVNINKHIKKCFDNINKLDFGPDPKSYTVEGMISGEGEKVGFKAINTKAEEIEGWLNKVQDHMVETLTRKMRQGKQDYEIKERKQWVLDHPGQIVATISQIYWSSQTEAYLSNLTENPNSMADWQNVNYFQLEQLTEHIRNGLDSIYHKIIVALITLDVHARDIIDKLVQENVVSIQDFNWLQQLRYYWDEQSDNISVKQVNAVMKYGYEYMGATSRLVITNLTDRCWMTITGALNIKLGAAPAGPAGTGKTESTKDLAKSLGMLCVVFNCSDQIEYTMMGRLFTGLAQQGAWTCLDEFNRIDIEVLSVVAQQLLQIRQALLRRDQRFLFMDKEINLKESVGVFITMNPGYAGRTELPDNLKVLFRPVSMMIPDYGLIAQIMLFAEGFETAKPLSKKMTQLYKLSSDQLSQQKHYDFGMRGIKSVLVMAGTLKRNNQDTKEDIILIRAMRDSNIPKFIKDDLPLFDALVQDLFPGVIIVDKMNEVLTKQVEESIDQLNLFKVENQIVKIMQLFETFQVRFGVMLVGETNSGKTTCFEILKHAMTAIKKSGSTNPIFQTILTYILNPKAISMGELYGEVNFYSKEWQDGLASQIMREQSMNETPDFKWVVFDGPVDALWIENMNTVLDDNMMLCLANGQRIKLRAEMRMLFEVQDLAVASPATVSRCGMVYLTSEELGWQPYVKCWIQKHINYEQQNFIIQLFNDNIDLFLEQLRLKAQEPIKTSNLQLLTSMCNILECILKPSYGFKQDQSAEKYQKFLQQSFVFSLIWGIGTTCYENNQDLIDQLVRKMFSTTNVPHSDSVYGFYIDPIEIQFLPWMDKAPEFIYDKDQPYFNLMVPTIDTIRYSYVAEILLDSQKMVYVTGPSGTGKSVVISTLLRNIKEPRMVDPVNIIFSAQTSSYVTQLTIESKLQKNKQYSYGARPGRKVAIFIDDINMPSVEEYGAQPPIEMLRLLVDKGGVYDRKERYWKNIENTIILACSAPPGGGRNNLTQRFTRHFNILCLPQPNQKTLFKIFESIMSGFLGNGFQDVIKKLSENVTNCTIQVYQRILKEKLPIPSKFHYTFNLRDVSKVFQGMLMVKPHSIKDPDSLVRLWVHECSRVFHDRLINQQDKEWYQNLIVDLLGSGFNNKQEKDQIFGENSIKFGDLLRLETKDYEEIKDIPKLIKILDDFQDDFMQGKSLSKLIFFDEAIEHVLRIARVLRQPRGSAMLIGVGGSGKQSLTKLCSFMLESENKSIEITKDFGIDKFREFIRELKYKTGRDGNQCTFLFTDTQIVNESFLEDINSLLNSGEVPNIWEIDERKKIIEAVRPENTKLGRIDEPDVIYQTFVERCRQNLHIVLCMSPVGDQLRIRCRKFPSLVDCCNLNWFSAWPENALISVSSQLMTEIQFSNDQYKISLSQMCKDIHMTSTQLAEKFELQLKRKVYTTPKSYLDFISLYQTTYGQKQQELQSSLSRLSNGLTKLDQANVQVAQLKIDLTELQPQLIIQSEQVKLALIQVEEDSKIANEKEVVVSAEAAIVNKQASEIAVIADEAQKELDRVIPELERALKEVENIDKQGLISLRTINTPPKIVEIVMEGVCILLGVKYNWKTAQGLLQDLNKFINVDILQFDKENVKEKTIQNLKKFLELNADLFQVKVVAEKVSAAKDLCGWVLAINTFADVSKKVGPKKEMVKQMEVKLKLANDNLKKKMDDLNEIKANVAKLKKESDECIRKKQETETLAELTKARLLRAEKLTSLLVEEGKRWVETVAILQDQIKNSIGDVFIATACLSYMGPFTGIFRQEMTSNWIESIKEREIPISDNFSVNKTLGNPVEIRDWMMYGLPSDSVSQDNSLYCMKGKRWPLMIDPQFQANKWIKNTEQKNLIKVVTFKDQRFALDMKSCLMQGIPILIQDVEEILDPQIDTILQKSITYDKGRYLIKFGDSEIDYDNNFRLYMTSKLPNPNYLPEVFIKVSIINFTVTFEGLEDQLLADVVKNEEPAIEQQRDDNIVNLAGYKKKITDCEKLILQLLNDSKPETLLDDVDLISTLESSKVTSEEIKVKIEESTILEQKIELTRNGYKDVSIRGSILFFVIKDLSIIDPMYQYSLQYIKRLFNQAMQISEQSNNLQTRLENLINSITKVIYTNVCRGLFEAHKLIFSFLVATSIDRQKGIILDDLWSLFLRGAGVVDTKDALANPDNTAITDIAWDFTLFLDQNYEKFNGLSSNISKNWTVWQKFQQSEDPFQEKLPGDYQQTLDLFDKLLIVKIFKPEKLMFGFSNYVENKIGKFYLEIPTINMSEIYLDSDVKTPIIFVLSSGADPTQYILGLAKEKNFLQNLQPISLGQGQGKVAEAYIKIAKAEGKWILLQNCHLAKSWMPELENIILGLIAQENQIHQDFRLFLTSMPATYFPVSILQNGIKLTTEPPRGIKANLRRSLKSISEQELNGCKKPNIFHKLLLGTCFFHSIIQERRKFGPLGWNIRYEFNDSDLETSRTVLQMLLDEQENTPWDALNFVTGHINYGGRVTDDWDRRCLLSILQNFYVPSILQETYMFSSSNVYYIPKLGNLKSYQDYVENLPIRDNPEVFGLHENANINYQYQESDRMMQTILSIQPRVTQRYFIVKKSSSGKTSDQILMELAQTMLTQIPKNLRQIDGHEELFVKNEQNLIPSLSTVLIQEMARFNILLNCMTRMLQNLILAIDGLVVMSQELDLMYYSLLNNQVPKSWESVAYPSLKPLASWLKDLNERVNFMSQWLINSNPNAYWISGFFFPQGFLTGVLQTFARKYKIPIDQLNFQFKVLDQMNNQISVKPPDGVYIYGMYLEGASWNKKTKSIVDQKPGEMNILMPVIYLMPTSSYTQKQEDYICPLYKTSVRAGTLSTTGQSTNFILQIDLPSLEQKPQFWTLRGAALLTQLND